MSNFVGSEAGVYGWYRRNLTSPVKSFRSLIKASTENRDLRYRAAKGAMPNESISRLTASKRISIFRTGGYWTGSTRCRESVEFST